MIAMTNSEAWIAKIIFGGVAALFAVLAAIAVFMDLLHSEQQQWVQTRFRVYWQAIGRNQWLMLPEKVIGSLLKLEERFRQIDALSESRSRGMTFLWCGTPIAAFIGLWLHRDASWAIMFCLPALPCLFMVLHGKGRRILSRIEDHGWTAIALPPLVVVVSLWVYGMGIAAVAWIELSLKMSLFWASISMILLLPMYWLLLWTLSAGPAKIFLLVVPWFRPFPPDRSIHRVRSCFALGASASFAVTYFSLLLGHVARPTAPVPQTLQMLLSNVIFDGCTMVATVLILRWAVSKGTLRIPGAIAMDTVVAGILACGSLYFGLIGSSNALSPHQVLSVLLGRSPDGSDWEFGPYFWAMHTTFIPTAIYLCAILFCWLAKCVLTTAHWFFGKAQEHKNPLKLTAAACGVMIAVFSFGTYCAGAVQDYLKEKEKVTATQVVEPNP
jgi:hypothetical protein